MERGGYIIKGFITMGNGWMESVKDKEKNMINHPITLKVYNNIIIGKFINGLKS